VSQPLDIFQVPLNTINLIEASAGTGKTYAIAGLYVRLVVEQGYGVGDILVVTFTRAATEELKERIRNRLFEVRQAFQAGCSSDTFCHMLLARCTDKGAAIHKDIAIRRLNNALMAFDEAAIFTIHGFCQRVLTDTAFASGMPFDTEILADQSTLLKEIVEDFWRCHSYQVSPRWAYRIIDTRLAPTELQLSIQSYLGKPYLKIAELAQLKDFAAIEKTFATAFAGACELWLSQREEVIGLLLQAREQCLNKITYHKNMENWFVELDEYFAQDALANPRCPNKFENFTTATLRAKTKKGQSAPVHTFFDACETLHKAVIALEEGFERSLQRLRYELFNHCNHELRRRKRELQIQSYDDLLGQLREALDHPQRGVRLAEQVRQRFSAALIDEFQDTDPVQYDIFNAIYKNTGQPVFLVGDPKQAIYSFRGADIFAYLQARQQAAAEYTLAVNWRSDPALIAAINGLFQRRPDAFLLQQIPFQAVQPAVRARSVLHLTDATSQGPLQLWFMGRTQDGKPRQHYKKEASQQIAKATAAEIARLLNLSTQGQAYIEDTSGHRENLQGGHIAVLVRDRWQALLVRDALLDLGVSSVQHSRDSVFVTQEAQDLERVLRAIATVRSEGLIKAALLTELLGVSGNELQSFLQVEADWEKLLIEFADYHESWRTQGFIRMFRRLLIRRDIYRRLLSFRDGERRLTNLLHLGELLQAANLDQRLGMVGLVKWLAEQRQTPNGEDEDQQLRLESDAELVQIVTVHKSKGLEYPVVFCPFLWDTKGLSKRQNILTFHDPDDDFRAVLDFGSPQQQEWRRHADRETLAEDLRLAYVALTRAKYRCYMVWGAIKEAEKSALAWLLHAVPTPTDVCVDALEAHWEYVKNLTDAALAKDLADLVVATDKQIDCHPLPDYTPATYQAIEGKTPMLAARQFQGQVRVGRCFTSFTALYERRSSELPDYDATLEHMSCDVDQARSVFTFPRGARAGRCLHAILEQIDFRCSTTVLEEKVQQQLLGFGFASEWTNTITAMLEAVLHTPLDESGRLTLAQVERSQRLTELEFLFPFKHLQVEHLRRLVETHSEHGKEQLAALDFRLLEGFMRGFIDLVVHFQGRFYVVDYKSNWLGPDLQDYQPEYLDNAMTAGCYHLQYLIYSVAVHRYLTWRLPDYDYNRHFGGVRYLFLRGMRPELGLKCGQFADRPPWPLIRTLDRYLQKGEDFFE
jgi:exodeoxyribonuclease V beta subunit